jgi:hypothetical protein
MGWNGPAGIIFAWGEGPAHPRHILSKQALRRRVRLLEVIDLADVLGRMAEFGNGCPCNAGRSEIAGP